MCHNPEPACSVGRNECSTTAVVTRSTEHKMLPDALMDARTTSQSSHGAKVWMSRLSFFFSLKKLVDETKLDSRTKILLYNLNDY